RGSNRNRKEPKPSGPAEHLKICLMGRSRVIVESPAKDKTINKYLGSDYTVKASMGHVKDLPKKELGVDVKNGFKPTYNIIPSKARTIQELKAAAAKADAIY